MKKMEMKLLGTKELYCIKIDYFMYDSKTDTEYTEPLYLSIDTKSKAKDGTPINLIIFKETITPELRVFDTEKEAKEYMDSHISNPCFCENQRVIKIKYNCENGEWEEC